MEKRLVVTTESRQYLAGFLTLLVHGFLAVLLFFSINWKFNPPQGAAVELWQELPPSPRQSSATETLIKSEALTPKPMIQLGDAQSVRPPIEMSLPLKKPAVPVKKKVKKNLEKSELKDEPKQLSSASKKKNQEQARKEAVTQRLQQQQDTQQKLQKASAQAHLLNEVAKYKARILAKIKSRIIMPPDLPGNPAVEYRVTLLPGGNVLRIMLRKHSGFDVFDVAVERAVILSQPLPLPPDSSLFSEFRNLSITVHYIE